MPIELELRTDCAHCGTSVSIYDTRETAHGTDVCDDCIDTYFVSCYECDEYSLRSLGRCAHNCERPWDGEVHGLCNCGDCMAERAEYGSQEAWEDAGHGGSVIRDYSYRPTFKFRGEGPLFLGPEIEVEVNGNRQQVAKYAADQLGELGYLKSDGSLDNGFEMVTHPMSYAWAMSNFPWEMLPKLSNMGAYTDEERTGLHVHVSRTAFRSPCHTYRWMKLIYRNQNPVCRLARRTSHQWAAFDPDHRKRVKHYAKGERNAGRYSAINVQNYETFELRMFASSLDPQEVQAAFGFAAASVEYTRNMTAADITKRAGWSWDAFTQWVSERPEYEPLYAQLTH